MEEDVGETFLREGFVAPVQVLDAEEAAGVLAGYRTFVARYGSEAGGGRRVRGNKVFRVHLVAQWAHRIVTHPRLLAAVSSVLGSSNLLVWSSDLTVKTGGSSECFGWHQDEAYADLGPAPALATAWVALTDSGPANGCVRFLRGSHTAGTLPHSSLPRTGDNNLVLGQVVPSSCLPPGEEVDCCLQAGQASLHGWRTVHSSRPNTSAQDRVGLAIRYMRTSVRQSQAVVRDRVSLVQGSYTGDWFEVEAPPVGDYGKGEWGEHKKSMEREWERRRRSKELGLLPSHKEREKEGEGERGERE